MKKFAIFKYAISYWVHRNFPDDEMYYVNKVWFNAS